MTSRISLAASWYSLDGCTWSKFLGGCGQLSAEKKLPMVR
jgi:hypothetical protein